MRTRAPSEYVSQEGGAKILGVSYAVFARLAGEGRFGTIEIPSLPTRYRRADVEAFRDRCIKPAAKMAVGA